MGQSHRRPGRAGAIGPRVIGAFVILVAGTVGIGIGAGPSHAAPGEAFTCETGTVFIAQDIPTRLHTAVQTPEGQIAFEPEGAAAAMRYNAVGFRAADGFLYGIAADSGVRTHLVRIGQAGIVTDLGSVAGLPLPTGAQIYNQGTMGAGALADTLFVAPSIAGDTLMKVDVPSMTATALTLSQTLPNLSDLVFLSGFVWGLDGSADLWRIDPDTGVVDRFATGLDLTGSFGAQWVYGNGNLGVGDNATGVVHQITIDDPASASPSFRLVSSMAGPRSGNNDGASCPGPDVDLAVEKRGPATYTAGAEVSYTLAVTNHGPGVSSGGRLTDPVPAVLTGPSTATPACSVTDGVLGCAVPPLDVGETFTATVSGTVADGTSGDIANSAMVMGNEHDPVPANDRSTWTIRPTADLTLTKTADTAELVAGRTITYTLTATNTGNATLTDVSIDEVAFDGAGPMSSLSCRPGQPATLAPGERLVCTTTYTVTQRDVDAGQVVNTARARGNPPPGVVPPASPTDSVTVRSAPAPGVEFDKRVSRIGDVNGNGVVDRGDEIHFAFRVRNTGNVTLTDIRVEDDLLAGAGVGVACPTTSLAPGRAMTCRSDAPYMVTAADVRRGVVVNSAVVIVMSRCPIEEAVGGGTCRTTARDETRTPVHRDETSAVLAEAGAPLLAPLGVAGVLLAVAGLSLLVTYRRRLS